MLRSKKKKELVEIEPNNALVKIKETNKVVISLIAFAGTNILALLAILILLVTNNKLASKKSIFVQQQNGSIVPAQEKDLYYRSEEVIKKFVTDWLYLTFELDNQISESQQDNGVVIKYNGDEVKVPSKVYVSSYALKDGFREAFLKKYSELIPTEYYTSEFQSQLIIYHVGKPIRKENKYYVLVTSTRIDKNINGEIGKKKFNKTIVLEPIEPYKNVLEESEPSAFRNYLSKMLKNGLIISSMENYREDIK